MRAIHVFILRLLVDSDYPQTLRGSIASVLEGKPRPFADEQSLLSLLRQAVPSALDNQIIGKNETENEDEN